jgi:hypothetical protein
VLHPFHRWFVPARRGIRCNAGAASNHFTKRKLPRRGNQEHLSIPARIVHVGRAPRPQTSLLTQFLIGKHYSRREPDVVLSIGVSRWPEGEPMQSDREHLTLLGV